jgi:uncharacterized delta-60 repeat protein
MEDENRYDWETQLLERGATPLMKQLFPGLMSVWQDRFKQIEKRVSTLNAATHDRSRKAFWRTPMSIHIQKFNPFTGLAAKAICASVLAMAGLSLSSCGQTPLATPETISTTQIDSSALPSELTTELTAQAAAISGQLLYSKTATLPGSAYSSRMFIQPDQRTVVASINTSEGLLVSRFLPNGQLDPSFGTNGSVSFDVAPGFDSPSDVITDGEGRVLISGLSALGFFDWDAFVVRLTPRGARDASFANNGAFVRRAVPTATYNAGASTTGNVAQKIRVAGNKIVVLGSVAAPYTPQPFVWRLTNRGALDTSFAGDGEAVLDPTGFPSSSGFFGLDLRSNGKIMIASTDLDFVDSPDLIPRTHFYVAQLNPNGSLDATFGSAGVARTIVEANKFATGNIALLENGKLIVAGSGASGYGLLRLSASGVLEKSKVNSNVIPGGNAGFAKVIRPLSDGKILVSGSENNIGFLARFDKDFNLDTGFATGGYFRGGFGIDFTTVNDVRVNGGTYSLAVSGYSFNPNQESFVYSIIAR